MEKLSTRLIKFRKFYLNLENNKLLLDEITEWNQSELQEGIRGDGTTISPLYRKTKGGNKTKYQKHKEDDVSTYKLSSGIVDLRLSGDFYKSLETETTDIPYIFETESDYSQDYFIGLDRYDNGTLLDLTDKNRKIVANKVAIQIINEFDKIFK